MTPNTSLQYQIVKQSDYQRMPWKNGRGDTLEIRREEDESGLRFRISQASVVENGVFSDFSGLQRTLVLLSGDGMTLEHKGKGSNHTHRLDHQLDMAQFDGGDETKSTLIKGPIEDLNIMVRQSDTIAKVQAGFAPTALTFSLKVTQEETMFTGFYANKETIVAYQVDHMGDTETLCLPSQSLLYIEQHKLTAIELITGSGVLIEINTL